MSQLVERLAEALGGAGNARFFRAPGRVILMGDHTDDGERSETTHGGHPLPSCSTTCYAPPMAREITQRELRNQSGEIMRKLDEGETFIVTRNGVPVGELAPLRRHRFVAAEAATALFETAPPIDYERFRADLDATATQDLTPRG